jgi:hypothetical protein
MNLTENALTLLASETVALQDGDSKTVVYVVPYGKKAIVTQVIIRNPSASLADGNDFDIGDGANADTWKTAVDLSGMTGTDDYMVISNDNAVVGAVFDAGDEFGIKPATGATADATATMEVIGYEFNA